MEYTITRYEEKSDALFIRIESNDKPVYIEHWFTEDERTDAKAKEATIEGLIAELEIKDEEYEEPEKFVNKIEDAKLLTISKVNIAAAKLEKKPKGKIK